MAYGITSESELIDYNSIRNGCVIYMNNLEKFQEAAQAVMEAGQICDKKALNINGESLQPVLFELAQAIANAANQYAECVNDVNSQAVNVYNSQVNELNAYFEQQANRS